MASAFIGGGLPDIPPSAAAHTDANAVATTEGVAAPPITTLEPPASNAGSDDPSAGIAKEAGGLSSTAHIGSPVTEDLDEKQTVVGGLLESVFGKKERSADEVEVPGVTTTTTSQPSTSSTGIGAAGVLGAVAGAAVAGTAAVAGFVGLSNTQATPQEEGEKTAAVVEQNVAETQAAASEKAAETQAAVSEKTVETQAAVSEKAAEVSESAKQTTSGPSVDAKESASETTATANGAVSKFSADENEDAVLGTAPETETAPTVESVEEKKKEDHAAAVRENKDAIPTAGGEKLGAAHEGESEVIPPVPSTVADETKPGQTDGVTADNTAANVDSASAAPATTASETPVAADTTPAPSSKNRMSILGHKREGSEASGKPKFFDRVKAKLRSDKKDKA